MWLLWNKVKRDFLESRTSAAINRDKFGHDAIEENHKYLPNPATAQYSPERVKGSSDIGISPTALRQQEKLYWKEKINQDYQIKIEKNRTIDLGLQKVVIALVLETISIQTTLPNEIRISVNEWRNKN